MSNLFGEVQAQVIPEFKNKDFTGYTVLARFRNKADYDEFMDLIGESKLKYNPKKIIHKVVWPKNISSAFE